MKSWPAVRAKADCDQDSQQRWQLFEGTKPPRCWSFCMIGCCDPSAPCVHVRLEVWFCVQPLRCVPSRVRPSDRASWLPVPATGPHGRTTGRTGTVCCVISHRCRRGVHRGCTWDRSNDWGTQTRPHINYCFFFYICLECFSPPVFDFQRISLDGFADGDLDERLLQDSKYDMLEFAKKYFRQDSKGKGWDKGRTFAQRVKILTNKQKHTNFTRRPS